MDQLVVKNIRTLIADIVEKANSGHPGAPLGLATFVYTLYKDYLKINPLDHKWVGRDIFILSNGHSCVIQYIMNYMLGFLTLDDLKQFRQLNSLTPGHPEIKTKGIEVTTGPLGQGVGNAVGFAISLKKLNMKNKVYCIFGDGCYMEGVSQEAFSMAACLNLDNITFIYDFNQMTIDGSTSLSMNENVEMRFKSLGFHVMVVDGEDVYGIKNALECEINKPKVIILHTLIGRDSILENNAKAHGSPLGVEGVKNLKMKYEIPLEDFYIAKEVLKEFENIRKQKLEIVKEVEIPSIPRPDINDLFISNEVDTEKLATRKHFSNVLNNLKEKSSIICGSADLVGSCLNSFKDSVAFSAENRNGNYINFGIREHGMCAIMNGISGHGFFIPVFSTFLNFIMYAFPAVRLASMDKLNNIYVLTHDSICVGEDGPTHQPIEVLLALRATPNMFTFRPCDVRECRAAIKACFMLEGTKAVVLSRQKLPFNENTDEEKCLKGAYYLIENEKPDVIILATGSEVELACKVVMECKYLRASLVSFFSWELFDQQDESYKRSILIPNVPKISIEALTTYGWQRYSDYQIGLDRFGWSGKCNDVYEHAGFTVENVIKRIMEFLNK